MSSAPESVTPGIAPHASGHGHGHGDSSRRLKAIMFTDIKGYSSMMGMDEAKTVQAVLEHRDIVRECLARHEGQEHETIGDAFVVLFDSVVNAVRCGAEIQAKLAQRNATLPVSEQVWLRIGIHLGDIILQGDGIYGDGVNVAARVQDRADPGGISITEQVFLQIDGKVDMPIEALGKVELKNIRTPHSLYRLKLDSKGPAPSAVSHRPLWLALGVVAIVALALAWVLVAQRAQPGQVAAAPAAPPPPVAAAAPHNEDAKAAAGRKVAQAMATSGAARIELLREALTLDPENAAVQNMLAMSVGSVAGPAAATPTAIPMPPAVAAPQGTAPAAAGQNPTAVKAPATRVRPATGGQSDGETRIKRAIVVE